MKKVIKKIVKKVKKATKTSGPEMVSYSMRMTIPTGDYSNIAPEILVKGGTIEEAHDFIAPHMNRLWKEYFMCLTRPAPVKPAPKVEKPAEKPVEKAPEAPKMPPVELNKVNVRNTPPPAPASAVALNKATQAITSCMSKEALDLLSAQVEKSTKLTDENKVELRKLVAEKSKVFEGK